ncbi:hypothetical protein Y1Q_0010290 [Alligator mississippiensis]|uniref:Uncharacterized protein n=1 Tax=Alligator mississippiensis TaxID=8496 RepID=A0A151NM94_ALLMI|nr:hypothetical protein Y1Q_0010290 [Alligator mississippiensis]
MKLRKGLLRAAVKLGARKPALHGGRGKLPHSSLERKADAEGTKDGAHAVYKLHLYTAGTRGQRQRQSPTGKAKKRPMKAKRGERGR